MAVRSTNFGGSHGVGSAVTDLLEVPPGFTAIIRSLFVLNLTATARVVELDWKETDVSGALGLLTFPLPASDTAFLERWWVVGPENVVTIRTLSGTGTGVARAYLSGALLEGVAE